MFKPIAIAAMMSVACYAEPQNVLVELFTSEGCSSCPPADALLEELDRTQPLPGIRIVVMSEHVDYWNDIGWKDPYSDAAFSRRQEQYVRRFHLASAYTPQVVVDGKIQMVGSDRGSVRQAIAKAAEDQKPGVRTQTSPTSIQVDADALDAEGAVVMLASVEASVAISKVVRGENSGRVLRHVAVVRSLKKIGVMTKGKPFTVTVPLAESAAGRRWIAFVQEREQGRILGVARDGAAEPR